MPELSRVLRRLPCKGAPVGGISIGLVAKHKFVKKDEGKTCAFCHGGRVYPEYTGEYGGAPDVHYQKGMLCMDCHKKAEFHGDGTAYIIKNEVKQRPACKNCHKPGNEAKMTAQIAHREHEGKGDVLWLPSGAAYRQCQQCHLGGRRHVQSRDVLGRIRGTRKH